MVGSNDKPLTFLLDTGSGYTLINSGKSSFCQDKGNDCDKYGTVDTSSNSLALEEKGKLQTKFGKGQIAIGDFYSDVFKIGNRKVTGTDFALLTTSSFEYNLLGLGYPYSGYSHPNLPQSMVNSGLIKTTAFSIWLNSLHATTGSILFGGLDRGKYSGKLETLPVQKDGGEYDEFYVMLEGISATVNNKLVPYVKTERFSVVIDSGSTYTYLPLYLAQLIWKAAGIRSFHEENNSPLIRCDTNTNFALYFSFGSQQKKKNIRIPISQLIISNPDTSPPLPQGQCHFGIFAVRDDATTTYLGETFMRSAYMVVDLENNQISLAQASNIGSSRIIELDGRGVSAINLAEGEGDDGSQDETESAEFEQIPDDVGTDAQVAGVPDNDAETDTQVAGVSGQETTDSNAGEAARGKASYSQGDISQADVPENSDSNSLTQNQGTSEPELVDNTSSNTEDSVSDPIVKVLSSSFPDLYGKIAGTSDPESSLDPDKLASNDASNKKQADFGQANLIAFNGKNTGSAGDDKKEINLDGSQLPNQGTIDFASNSPSGTDSVNIAAYRAPAKGTTDSNSNTASSGKVPTAKTSGSDKLALAPEDLFLDTVSAKAKRRATKRTLWRAS